MGDSTALPGAVRQQGSRLTKLIAPNRVFLYTSARRASTLNVYAFLKHLNCFFSRVSNNYRGWSLVGFRISVDTARYKADSRL